MNKKQGLLFVVSGASGTGKTTLCRAMVKVFPDLLFSVSHTTRRPRRGDVAGRDYYFVSAEEFQGMIERGEFVEWAEIYGHRYGTSREMVKKAAAAGQDLILDIDAQGAGQIRNQGLPGIFVFIFPPSLAELKRRLQQRNTEGREALEKRLEKAREEFGQTGWYDYFVVNDDLPQAREQLRAIILAERCRRARNMGVVEKLLNEREEHIS